MKPIIFIFDDKYFIMIVFENYGIADLEQVSAEIIRLANGKKIWTFNGEMGAGKTTLIKSVCKQMGVTDEVSSPTFSLVNEYKTTNDNKVFHFDFYRIKNIEEAFDIGYEDYFDSGSVCLIEWPEKIEPLLQREDIFAIDITVIDNKRQISVN